MKTLYRDNDKQTLCITSLNLDKWVKQASLVSRQLSRTCVMKTYFSLPFS